MIFRETPLGGTYVVEPEPIEDERGFFARTFAVDEFEEHGLETRVVQCNVSFNARAGTLRGLHYQADPMGETKLVSCPRGAIWDVALDLRRDSPSFGEWFAQELTAANRLLLYIPRGVAHGFQTLEDATEVAYVISQAYSPEHARGVRWDDPAFGIEWPDAAERTISDRDRAFPDFAR